MNLMTLVRLLVLVVIGWTVVSLGAGALGVGSARAPEPTFFLPRRALEDAIPEGRPDLTGKVGYRLVDQTSGQIKSLALPDGETWSLLSVSPWRDKDGNLEAVGRWVSHGDEAIEFCGLGCLSLPSSTVKARITLDVLPTGKPCWLAARPGEVLFPAGDGRLYRCNITGQAGDRREEDSAHFPLKNQEQVVRARAITWEAEMPGTVVVVLADPTVLPEPENRHLVFVSLGVQERRNGGRLNLPTKLWWILMDDDDHSIVQAGRLTVPEPDSDRDESLFERLPNVVPRSDGKLNLVYLTRLASENTWQLRSSRIEIDPQTKLPRMDAGAEPMLLAKDVRAEPLVVSAQGDSVHAVNRSGRIVEHPIPR
jgi:hypothetical protein